jgi:hypothetical protein
MLGWWLGKMVHERHYQQVGYKIYLVPSPGMIQGLAEWLPHRVL